MTNSEIKTIMHLVRPVICRIYGRQSLKLSAYMIMDKKDYFPFVNDLEYMLPREIWVEVYSLNKGTFFKAKLEEGEVVSLAEKRLEA